MCYKMKPDFKIEKSGILYTDVIMVVCFSLFWALKTNSII